MEFISRFKNELNHSVLKMAIFQQQA